MRRKAENHPCPGMGGVLIASPARFWSQVFQGTGAETGKSGLFHARGSTMRFKPGFSLTVSLAGSGGAAFPGYVLPSGRGGNGVGGAMSARCQHKEAHKTLIGIGRNAGQWANKPVVRTCVDISGISNRRFMAHGGGWPKHEKTPANWHFSLYLLGFWGGGGNRGRTGDLRLMSPPLCQLSYPAGNNGGK